MSNRITLKSLLPEIKKSDLVGKPRYKIYIRKHEGGPARTFTSSERPRFLHAKVLGHVMSATNNENGNIEVISAELVDKIVTQQQDKKYGQWHTIGSIKVEH